MIGWRKKDVFISYRRDTGSELAQIVYRYLWRCGYRVYLDVHNKEPGQFPPKLITRITEAKDFVVVLTPDSLNRCVNEEDWLRQEIALAFQLERNNIVPFRKEDFNWPDSLPKDIASLPSQEWVTYSHTRSDEALRDLRRSLKSRPVRLYLLVAVLLALVAAIPAGWFLLGTGGEAPSTDTSRYGFEDGAQGWVAQTYVDSQGCTRAAQSDKHAKRGRSSLEMQMDLAGGDARRSKGEAWVNWKNTPPASAKVPADLTDHVVTAWVYAPQDSKGDPDKPNGFQLFLKDDQWRSLYGRWQDITIVDAWAEISMTVSLDESACEHMDPGFDPSRIMAIGVKMGAGEGSRAPFKGSVFVDAVDWKAAAPDTTRPPAKPNKPAAAQPKENQP